MPRLVLPLVVPALLLSFACNRTEPRVDESRHPYVVVALDGADWDVIERLWRQGDLPHLRSLAAGGTSTVLGTDYGRSPAIWTTVATGVVPQRHGITDFVLPTAEGDLPVSSTMRRVPAIWNMASLAGLRVAVVGWWPTWPAEKVNGVMVTDRADQNVEDRIWPPARTAWLEQARAQATDRGKTAEASRLPYGRDNLMVELAEQLIAERFDLLLVYVKSLDVASHRYWKYFEPNASVYDEVDPGELRHHRDRVPSAYRAADAMIGELRAAAPPNSNFIVLSDHGFHAVRERLRVYLDLDLLFEHIGMLARKDDGSIDLPRTRVYTYATPLHKTKKKLRFPTPGREPGGTVTAIQRTGLQERLESILGRVRYATGAPAFRVRPPTPEEEDEGVDLIVEVLKRRATEHLDYGGKPLPGVVRGLHSVTGGHKPKTPGILLAAGPDIDPDADLDGMDIHDIAPTLLYGLGLPVAEDFDGQAWRALFHRQFRRRHPLQTIASWGDRRIEAARPTANDDELVEELRALGYL